MNALIPNILVFIIVICAILTIIGIIRPSFSIWWSASPSRVQVLRVWGLITVIASILYFIWTAVVADPIKDEDRTSMTPISSTEQIYRA